MIHEDHKGKTGKQAMFHTFKWTTKKVGSQSFHNLPLQTHLVAPSVEHIIFYFISK